MSDHDTVVAILRTMTSDQLRAVVASLSSDFTEHRNSTMQAMSDAFTLPRNMQPDNLLQRRYPKR